MIIYTFLGVKLFPGAPRPSRMNVSVIYTPISREISAVNANGGTPSINYDTYNPDLATGTLIFETTEGTDVIKVFFQKNYPFGYIEVIPDQTVLPPILVIDSIVTTPQIVIGESDGTATINVSGGALPYQYSLDGVNYQSSNLFIDLSVGDYTVFVKGTGNPAITTGTFTIAPAPTEPEVTDPSVKDIIALSGAEISIQNAYKRVEVLSEFGKVPSVLYNGDFEQWDGQNFAFWTRYGGLNFSRIQRTVTNSAGVQVPVENHALQFNEGANSGKFLRSASFPIYRGDTMKIQYNVSKTDTGQSRPAATPGGARPDRDRITYTYYVCKIRIKVGDYHLFNEGYGSDYRWVNSLATIGNLIDNKNGDINTFSFNFSVPECPVDGDLTIDLFGFEKVQQTKTTLNGVVIELTPITVVPFTDPAYLDDLLVSKSSKSNDNDVTGLMSVSESLGYYTEKPDMIKILFGDYFLNSAGSSALGNLYAMKVDEKYSTGWYEYGSTNSPVPFGLALAKSVLRAYQKPFRFWLGGLTLQPLATEFNYMNTFNFDVPGQQKFNNKIFALLGGDIDLKTNTIENARLAEIFDRPGKSNDITVPSYPGTTPPVFVQDPTGDTDIVGIFTEEFTQEFT